MGKTEANKQTGRYREQEEAVFLSIARKAAPRRYHLSVRAPSNLANTSNLGEMPSIHTAWWPESVSK